MSKMSPAVEKKVPSDAEAPQISRNDESPKRVPWDETVSLDRLRGDIRKFAQDRNWEQFQTPRNLLLALVGEVGEVSEIFQWKGEVGEGLPCFSDEERTHLGEELSDVFFYLLRLSDVCGIDLGQAAIRKLGKNIAKYPVSKCYGKSTKYNKL